MIIERLGKKLTNFPWAVIESGITDQLRFDSRESAAIAYKNYILKKDQ